jgi:hypothetical protein
MNGTRQYLPIALIALLTACGGEHLGPGEIEGPARDIAFAQETGSRVATAAQKLSQPVQTQILFGDLHTHTSFSPDALIMGMPMSGGEGARPPADACDYARYCSAVDFWGISDHAEGVTPQRWAETRESIRQCNAIASDPGYPDLVSFLGWEWSHVAATADKHFGHKNVFFRDTADDRVPARAIAAPREQLNKAPMGRVAQIGLALMDWDNRDFYLNLQRYYDEIGDTPICERGVNSRQLPQNCLEIAHDPLELFSKLDDWGYEALVIPHGNTWGMNTPPETRWDKQLSNEYHRPDYQRLVEIYSGHGNSEQYRSWRAFRRDESGNPYCPPPSEDGFLPCCWRAGQLIQQRCEDPTSAACGARVEEARQIYIDAGISGHLTVPGAEVEDWLNCGQCEDCFNASFKMRPMTTTQYALTLNHEQNQPDRQRFRWGFIGSSDNHRARAGNGFKDTGRRRGNTEVMGADSESGMRRSVERGDPTLARSRRVETLGKIGLNELRNMERQQSFFLTGGLVAVHAGGRDRDSIWDALQRKQVYATSGERILLWFDLLRADGSTAPMGSAVLMSDVPRFRVSAAGAFRQLPGCPADVAGALGANRQASLCANECYNPGDERKQITRIEIVRIHPRMMAGEDTAELIEDVWLSFPCEDSGEGCSVEFEDEDFARLRRDSVYYARAIQEPTPAVNAGGVRCEYDERGVCVAVNPCYGDFRTDRSDDCLSPNEERAWSSPIYVDFGGLGQ